MDFILTSYLMHMCVCDMYKTYTNTQPCVCVIVAEVSGRTQYVDRVSRGRTINKVRWASLEFV